MIDIRLCNFDPNDQGATERFVAGIVPLLQVYFTDAGIQGAFNPDISGMVKDWWCERLKLVLAFNDNKPCGFMLCYIHRDVLTSVATLKVEHLLAPDTTTATQLKSFAHGLSQALGVQHFDAGS